MEQYKENLKTGARSWSQIGVMTQNRSYHAIVVCPPFLIGKAKGGGPEKNCCYLSFCPNEGGGPAQIFGDFS